MDNIENLKTDDRIADILKKLKEADKKASEKFATTSSNETQANTDSSNNIENDNIELLDQTNNVYKFEPVPWLSALDLDTKYIHYIKFDDCGNLLRCEVQSSKSSRELATLKLQKDYVCDTDYYRSRHYVLCVKQLACNDQCFDILNSNSISNIEIEDVSFVNTSVSNSASSVHYDEYKDVINQTHYLKYIVFTDLGIAEFIAASDEVPYPYGELNLSKWFEEISNTVQLFNTSYKPNNCIELTPLVNSIKGYKYDLITMNTPGCFTLDSSNSDSDSKICLKLRPFFSFIPVNKLLSCIKHYATTNEKSTEEFKYFLNTYFEII